ncbi:podocalyxin isoform X2 [Coregonus clupeaformis]|nr:podocalyxin isoform X2 [Coregonus clupeaformis]
MTTTSPITTAGTTAPPKPTHKVTTADPNDPTTTTASVAATPPSATKVTMTHQNDPTTTANRAVTNPNPSSASGATSANLSSAPPGPAGVSTPTPGSSSGNVVSTPMAAAGTGASSSSGTPTQTPPDSTAGSSPSHPPNTSSPVGSGSSLATATTSTQGGMVSTTTAETTTTTTTTTTTPPRSFTFSMSKINEENHERKDLEALCRQLMSQMHDANCTLNVRENNGHTTIDSVVMTGKVDNSVVQQYYEKITRKPSDNMTLIAILASCGALLAMIVGFAIYASYHRKSYRKNHQQHLTEELQTVESGYHDNPTLEVMEVPPEMQEKKVALNGEFNDSWIVPIDNLLKMDMPDEEDTHL